MFPFPNSMCASKAMFLQSIAWNPSDKDGDAILSNGNRTMSWTGTGSGGLGGGRATTGKSSGQNYFELTADTVGTMVLGIADAATSVGAAPGTTALSVGWDASGAVTNNNATIATYAAYASGDRLGFAFTATKLWMAKNGVWQSGNPSNNTGGISIGAATYFPMAYSGNLSVSSVSIQAQTFSYPPDAFLTF